MQSWRESWPITGLFVAVVLVGGAGCGGGGEGRSGEASWDEAGGASDSFPAGYGDFGDATALLPPGVHPDSAQAAAAGENRAPVASFEVSPVEGWAGLTKFRFDASSSADDRHVTRRLRKRWDFDGDGSWDISPTGRNVLIYTFRDAGTFRPRLRVTDPDSLADSVVAAPITVHPKCPPPDFALVNANPNSPSFGQTLRLADQRGHPVLVWFAAPSK